jgi:hypothetical protein
MNGTGGAHYGKARLLPEKLFEILLDGDLIFNNKNS